MAVCRSLPRTGYRVSRVPRQPHCRSGLLAPDIAFLAYLVNRTAAPVVYNVLHTYVVPAVCFLAGLRMQHAPLMGVGLIWIAHIGVDRMLGFGLKYAEGFRVTHLQKC